MSEPEKKRDVPPSFVSETEHEFSLRDGEGVHPNKRGVPRREKPNYGDEEIRAFIRAADVVVIPTRVCAGLFWIGAVVSILFVVFELVAGKANIVGPLLGLFAAFICGLLGWILWASASWFVGFSRLLCRITLSGERLLGGGQ